MHHHHNHTERSPFIIRRLNKDCYERQTGSHPSCSPLHCFFYLSEGTVLVEIGKSTILIQEDDLIFIPAGQTFKVRYYEKSKGYMGGFYAGWLNTSLSNDSESNRYDFLRRWNDHKISLDTLSSGRVRAIFERTAEECDAGEPNMEIVRAYVMALLAEVDSIYRRVSQQVMERGDSICNNFLEELFNGTGTADQRAEMEVLSVAGYAARLNITPNHLNKVVKSVTGKSPSVWIDEFIIQEAKWLLCTTSMPLGEIAARLGMHDQSYFARRFKKHEGLTPSEYRLAYIKR